MGIAVSDEILLSDDIDIHRGHPSSSRTDNDETVVTWIDNDGKLVTRRYDADGAPLGNKVIIAQGDAVYYSLPVYALSDGGWVQSFVGVNGSGGYQLNTVRYSATGELLATYTTENSSYPRLTKLGADSYAVFEFNYVSDHEYLITATFFDENGEPAGTREIGHVSSPNAAIHSRFDNGAWSIFLEEDGEFGTYALFSKDGTLLKAIEMTAGGSLNFNADGSYSIVRDVNDADAHTLTKIVEHYDANGQLQETISHPPIDYSYFYMGAQSYGLKNGNTVIVWTDYGWDDHGHLMMRVVDREGNLVVADTELSKVNPYNGFGRVVELSTGGWVVSWQGEIQVFNPDGTRNGETVSGLVGAEIIANDEGGWTVTYAKSSGEAGIWGPYGIYTRDFTPNHVNNAPVAITWFSSGLEDTANVIGNFSSYDPDGDSIAKIVIEELPASGLLMFDGVAVTAGQVIDVEEINKLTWTPPLNVNGEYIDSLKFNVVDEHGAKSTQPARQWFTVGSTDDVPIGDDLTLTIREDERIHITRDMFPVYDIDGDHLTRLEITPVVNGGTFTYGGYKLTAHTVISYGLDYMYFEAAANASGNGYAQFKVNYITGYGDGSSSEEHIFTINVLSVNDAPKTHDAKLYIKLGREAYLNDVFDISDIEGDDLRSIVVASLPKSGTLKLDGELIEVGDEIFVDDFDHVSFKLYDRPLERWDASFTFHVRDDGGTENGGDDLSDVARRFTFDVTQKRIRSGTLGDDVLTGAKKVNIIQGGAGEDIIFGGRGEDELHGGTGSDIFVLKPRGEVDSIYDFSLTDDRIDLTKTHINDFEELQDYLGENHETLAFIGFDSKTIPYEADGFLLFGIRVGDLKESNFIFAPL